jgi:hypothetical protein
MNAVTYLFKSAFAAHIGRSPTCLTGRKETGRQVLSPHSQAGRCSGHRSVDPPYRRPKQGCRRRSPPTGAAAA